MESSSTVSPAVGRAVDAPTLTEALRRTAANHPEIVAVRTPDDSVSLTWSELLGARRGGRRRAREARGRARRHGRDHARQPARIPHRRPGGGDARRDPVLDLPDLPAAEIEYLIDDAAAQVAIVEQALMRALLEARRDLPGLEHMIVVDGDPPDGHDLARRRRGLEPRVRCRGRRGARSGPTTC